MYFYRVVGSPGDQSLQRVYVPEWASRLSRFVDAVDGRTGCVLCSARLTHRVVGWALMADMRYERVVWSFKLLR